MILLLFRADKFDALLQILKRWLAVPALLQADAGIDPLANEDWRSLTRVVAVPDPVDRVDSVERRLVSKRVLHS